MIGTISEILCVLVCLPAVVFALQLGPFEIIPELTLEERYDTNIFLEPNNRRADLISYGAFQLKAAVPIRLSRARRLTPSLTYLAEGAAFANNAAENFYNQGIGAGLDVDVPLARPDQRLTFSASNRFRSVTEVSASAEQSDIGPRTRRNEHILKVDLGYFPTRRNEVHLSYDRLDLDQKAVPLFLDRNENTFAVTYFRRMSLRFAGLLEYSYKLVDFTDLRLGDPDFSSTGHLLAIGLRGDRLARLSGTFKVGVELRNFYYQSDVSRFFASGQFDYRITPWLLSSLSLSRAMHESTNQDFPFYDASITRLRFTQQVTPKITTFIEGAFELDEFKNRVSLVPPGEGSRRFDRFYEFGVGGDYQIGRWLNLGLSYLYRTKDSTVTLRNYVDNRGIFRIKTKF